VKLVLIQPPVEDFYDTDVRLQPIGLAYLAGAVRDHLPEVEIEILDFHHGWGRRSLRLPKELSYLREYYPHHDESPFSTFHQYYRFGASDADIARVLQEKDPDVVGISSLFTPYYREALAVARIAKEHTRARVVMGGSHVSADPHSILREPAVDFVVTGEGEKPLVRLLRALAAGAPCSRWFNSGQENESSEELPIPDLSSLRPESYRLRGRPMVFLVTSRSCPHRCSFCSVHTTFGLRYRRASVPRVVEEMKLRYREGYRVFDFEDDNLTYYKDEMKELCRAIRREFPEGDLELVAMNGISYLSLDTELLRLMTEAGFSRLNLALVSSDTSVLETTKRPHTVSKYLEVVEEAYRLGFEITSYQILGLPFESRASMVQTLVFAARLPVLLGASPFYLTPGSPIQRQLGVELSEADYFRARLTAMAWEGRDFTRDDVYTLFVTTRILNFLKSRGRSSRRWRLGEELLETLLSTGRLEAASGKSRQPLTRFCSELFFEVWEQLEYITDLEGGRIVIHGAASRSAQKRTAPSLHSSTLPKDGYFDRSSPRDSQRNRKSTGVRPSRSARSRSPIS